MNCPSCGEPDWEVQIGPAKEECVHCGSVFRLVRNRAESIAKKQELIRIRGRENVSSWRQENNGVRRDEP